AEDAIRRLGPLTASAEKARDDAKKACRYVDAAATSRSWAAAARAFVASTFPKGAPAGIQQLLQEYEAELAVLKKAATGETLTKDHLRKGLAFVAQKRGEPALAELEAAAETPDVPPCLHEQIMITYNDMKADLERRMKLIDAAVEAANAKCDYATARSFGEQVEAEDANLSWVVKELPRIKDLDKRQKGARALVQQAEAQAAAGLYDEALRLANEALSQAPECDKAAINTTIGGYGAKKTAAAAAPVVDQSLVLLLDTSGSMGSGGKMESAKQAATDAVKSIGPTTEVALLSYDGGCSGGWRVVQGFTTKHASIVAAIATLSPGGGTPTAPAIGFAHDYMQKNAKSKSAQILLMTDGQNDCGSMRDAGTAIRQSNFPVKVDAVGFGLGTGSQAQNDLGDLVRNAGNGTAYSANSSAELITAFRRAFIANQVKARDPFVTGDAGTRLAALFAAAMSFLKQNDMRGAVGQFQQAVSQFPTSPAAQFNASLAYEAAGQPLQALNHAERYLQLAPNAFDAGSVRERVTQLQAEQAANPRAIYAPNDCSALYRWAQREVRVAGNDAARKAKVYDIMTTAQRGDCGAAEKGFEGYQTSYVKRSP
ncbi:MAG: VWA domain-containing protein, partial [Gemmatimonadales bacterium]|nr:VWA domain-containing protein [Gemmatimonadales bacterium]